jgi:hypothetical protein
MPSYLKKYWQHLIIAAAAAYFATHWILAVIRGVIR